MEHRFETFTLLISGINRCIRKIKSREMAEFDLKSPHVSCLYYLYHAPSLTASELCEMCEEDKANISRSIHFLEEKGYLTSQSTTGKRYHCPLTLTEEGRRVACHITDRVNDVLLGVGKNLSDEERDILYRALNVIYGDLQDICKQ